MDFLFLGKGSVSKLLNLDASWTHLGRMHGRENSEKTRVQGELCAARGVSEPAQLIRGMINAPLIHLRPTDCAPKR
jgi:hypothetical protein